MFIKPFEFKSEWLNALNNKYGGLVLDDDYEEGVASSLAHQLMLQRKEKKVLTLGLKQKSAGFHANVDNLPPTPEEIYRKIKDILTNE